MYQDYLNESRVTQHRQDLMREAATERSLRAMKRAQKSPEELREPVVTLPRPSKVRQVWQAFCSFVFSRA
jgi:hypothetical protein